MSEILRDPLWQFIITVCLAVLAILVTVVVTVVIYLRQRQRKALTYHVVAASPLVSAADEVKGKLQILFAGTPIQNAHLIVVVFVNTGNTPIVESDFVAPVSLGFREERRHTSDMGGMQVTMHYTGKTKVLSADVIETKPPNSQVSLTINEANVLVRPSLLNPQDSITLKVLVTEFEDFISIDSRIVGVRQLTRYNVDERSRFIWTIILNIIIGVLAAVIISAIFVLYRELIRLITK